MSEISSKKNFEGSCASLPTVINVEGLSLELKAVQGIVARNRKEEILFISNDALCMTYCR